MAFRGGKSVEEDVCRLEAAISCKNLIEVWKLLRKITFKIEMSGSITGDAATRLCEVLHNFELEDRAVTEERDRLIRVVKKLGARP